MLPWNSLCHIMDTLQTLMTARCEGTHGFTELLQIHRSVMQSRNFPGFPDDH